MRGVSGAHHGNEVAAIRVPPLRFLVQVLYITLMKSFQGSREFTYLLDLQVGLKVANLEH